MARESGFRGCAFIALRHGPCLARAGHLDEHDAAPTDLELIRRFPSFSPPIPLFPSYLTRPVLLTYLFTEGT